MSKPPAPSRLWTSSHATRRSIQPITFRLAEAAVSPKMSPMKAIIDRHPWLPYVAPFALFVGLTGLQPYVPGGVAWVYPVKTVLTGLLILGLRCWLVPAGDWSARLRPSPV